MNEIKRGIVYILHNASPELKKLPTQTWGEGKEYFSVALNVVVDKVFEFIQIKEKHPDIIIFRDPIAYAIVSEHLARFKGMLLQKLTEKGITGSAVISASSCGSVTGVLSIVQTIYPDYSETEFMENIRAVYQEHNLSIDDIQHEYLLYRLEKTASVFITP